MLTPEVARELGRDIAELLRRRLGSTMAFATCLTPGVTDPNDPSQAGERMVPVIIVSNIVEGEGVVSLLAMALENITGIMEAAAEEVPASKLN